MQVESRRNITVGANLTGNNTFNINIFNVSFIPDEVIVRQITYQNDPAAPVAESFAIWTDLVGDYIGSFFDGSTCSPNITYDLKRSVQGYYNFKVHTTAGVVPALTGKLFLHLEFVRYKK